MTLIVGLNLSDKLILGADMRVSFSDGTHKDDILKISVLGANKDFSQIDDCKDHVLVAVAGDLELATFLFEEISKNYQAKKLSGDIRILFNQIENFVRRKMDYWLSNMRKPYRSCCFIFAGFSSDRRKEINPLELEKLISAYKKSLPSKKAEAELKEKLEQDKIGKILLSKVPKERMFPVTHNENTIKLKPQLEEALESHGLIKSEPDSLVFAVEVNREGVRTEVAEWGNLVARGTGGIKQEHISDKMLATLEVSRFTNNAIDGLAENSLIITEVRHFAKKESKIGSSVLTVTSRKDRFYPNFHTESDQSGNVVSGLCPYDELIRPGMVRKNAGLVHVKNNHPCQLIRFFDYKNKGKAQL